MIIYLRQQWEHRQDQYQPHNGNTRQDSHLTNPTQMEKMNQIRNYGKIKSFEEYYSTHESEETSQPSDSEDEENEVNRPDIYVTRSGRRSRPPERLICVFHTKQT